MKITITKEIQKKIDNREYYNTELFIKDCKQYIKAVESGRILYRVTHVSQSGMSRNISITSYEGTMSKGYYSSYYYMLEMLGFKFANKHSNDIKVSGCGMDMLFATNYDIINELFHMGFMSMAKCNTLAQRV